MNRFCVRFGSFGVSPFAYEQMLCPFLSFLIVSASLARYDASFATHLTCPGDLCMLSFKHVPMTIFFDNSPYTGAKWINLSSSIQPNGQEPHHPICACTMDVIVCK